MWQQRESGGPITTARRSTSRPGKARVGEAIRLRFGLVMVVGLIPLAAATLIEEIPLRGKQSEGVVAEM